jgi:adenine C2-methylase RlmN of 23S rRNA A2503 and tRNA A37
MATDMPGVSLALSLHAPTQELRKQIVPSARAYPLPKLLQAIQDYQEATQQRVFVEYVMLSGVNDGLQQAHELGQLLQDRDVVLNLIPWNPVYCPDGPRFEAPVEGQVAAFQTIVRGQYGVHCTVRQEKGQDISGEL